MSDTWRCKDCEAIITQEWDLCELCHSGWLEWLEKYHASSPDHTPDSDASRPTPL